MNDVIQHPVKYALQFVSKKWTLEVIHDMLSGKSRWTEFLHSNPGLSPKVLSNLLKKLESKGLIIKTIPSKTPLIIQYILTDIGKQLKRTLDELGIFATKILNESKFDENIPFKYSAVSLE